ncbi:MAG: hypothetical protein IJK79_02585 [Bacteroidales bacterium]|nr:hypothetical protein [Bacteroidales bacterium]
MNRLSNIFYCTLVFLLQLVLTDYVHLGPYVFLCLVPYLLINIPLSRSPHVVMLTAFAIGLGLDVLSDGVPGLNAFAAVLAAAPCKFLYRRLVNSDRQDKTEIPLPGEVGFLKYAKYLSAVTLVYMAAYVALDCISFRPVSFILIKFAASAAASIALALLLAIPRSNRP